MDTQEVLQIFEESKALLNGHFELRSGLHSNQFFQCAMVLQYPRIAERLCAVLAHRVRASLGEGVRIDGVLSPAMGGIPVGHEIGRALNVRSIFAEKQDGRLVLRRAFEVRPGETFVVAEDVVTRGGRAQECVDIVTARGGHVAAVAVLVNRSGGRADFGVPLFNLLSLAPETWAPDECPLCKAGDKPVHPGS